MKNYNTMLHMKLNSAVSVFSIAAAFSVFLPSPAYSGICFLPDCADEDLAGGGGNMNINEDTEFCESKGYTYYASGECPQYYAKVGTCSRDDHYLKCDAKTWCEQNGYMMTITSNVTPRHGANKTGITQPLVPFQNMWISPVRVTDLCINNVKLIISGLVVIPVIQTLVLPARNSKRTPDVVLMILLTEPAVRQADVRVIRP